MTEDFFEHPILNSPYAYPAQHWELDESRQPTGQKIASRRPTDFITPIPKPRKRRQSQDAVQQTLALFATEGISDDSQSYSLSVYINSIRDKVSAWRRLEDPSTWKVTPTTEKLLQHWRHYPFQGIRPFFCQVEAVETAIWLAEVAPKAGQKEKAFLEHLQEVNGEANPDLLRVCMKLATGAGKTTVMAMLIAWQTLNSVRHPNSQRFTKDFLIVTPGITIRDRLQVLKPNDANSYYHTRDLVPSDMVLDLQKANVVITNYHAFKLRERVQVAAGTRKMLQGLGPELQTLETEGQMIQRVMGSLGKNVLIINDEAHHCYREKPGEEDEPDLKGDEKDEAKKNAEAARLWISGLEAVKRKLGVMRVYDLSATPFFLSGSGYAEGTLFPWTVSDFSLMDAIECGIVKLPRVPVADNNISKDDMPKFRNLWEHIGKRMPKKGRGAAKTLDPLSLPKEFYAALDALYGHYVKTFDLWQERQIPVPPVFIVVCNNTSTSKLVYDYISGFFRENDDGSEIYNAGRLELFRNYDEHGNRLTRPKTLLIDSEQLESGDALDKNFRDIAAEEIERFRYEIGQRDGAAAAEKLTDQDLLREVMNTVGKEGKLGAEIRCVVSVSMLTEGWDTNTVTHVLGVRAFGTQLLCEQVIGRALRRYSY
jgi:type III restriction enzyme